MKIEMNPVKCGDCLLLNTEESTLIVDCGSDNRGNGKKRSLFAYSYIEDLIEYPKNKLELLITHFDADHYNGITEIERAKCLEKIHLPYYYFDVNQEVSETLAYILLLAKNRTDANIKSNLLIKLLLKIPELVKDDQDIVCVKASDKIKVGKRELDVLWPEYTTSIIIDKINWGERRDCIMAVAKGLIQKYENLNLDFKSVEDTIRGFATSLGKYISICAQGSERDRSGDFKETLDKLYREYEELSRLNKLINNEYKKVDINNKPLSFYTSYTGSPYMMYKSENSVPEFVKLVHDELITDMNSSSVIFEESDNMLFLGDANRKVIEHLKSLGTIKNHYKVVKVQHHGTVAYYTNSTPSADYYLISNGGYIKRVISEDFISKATRIYCTDGWRNRKFCNHTKSHGTCSSKCVPFVKGSRSITV